MFASARTELKTTVWRQALERHKPSGRRLLDLSASNPTECGFTYDAPAIMRALCSPASLQYHPDPKGLKSARQAVSDYYAEHGERVAIDYLLPRPAPAKPTLSSSACCAIPRRTPDSRRLVTTL